MQHTFPSVFQSPNGTATFADVNDRVVSPFRMLRLFGLELATAPRASAAHYIVDQVHPLNRMTVNFVNAHCVNTARGDADYRDCLKSSDLLLPDGVGIEFAARACGETVPENLNGTDLFPEICQRAAADGVGIFLLGGAPGVAEDAAAWVCEQWPSLPVRGTAQGYFSIEEEDALIERINRSRAGILFVGFGVPLQEQWIARNRHRLQIPVVMGVGGLFDYYSGRIPRAPEGIRSLKCEWIWRLAMEPRRMANRYLAGNIKYLGYTALEAARVREIDAAAGAIAKRAVDIAGAALALALLLPIFLATALAIRLEDKGPVFFRQTRIGTDGKPFTMIKFRSMFIDAEKRRAALLARSDRSGMCFKMQDDPRITRTGKIIRRLSIDELPQLLNVLGGSMSLVGPRPALASEAKDYRGRQWERLHGKPGITCVWQVKGRADIPFHRQAIMDRAYLRRRSLMTDLKLLFLTVPAVVSGRGAY